VPEHRIDTEKVADALSQLVVSTLVSAAAHHEGATEEASVRSAVECKFCIRQTEEVRSLFLLLSGIDPMVEIQDILVRMVRHMRSPAGHADEAVPRQE